MIKIADTWYVRFTDLTKICGIDGQIISNGFLRNSPIWQGIQDPSDRRRRLIQYDTMSEKYQLAVRETLCGGHDPETWDLIRKEQAKQGNVSLGEYSLVDLLVRACDSEYRRFLGLYSYNHTNAQERERRLKSLARAAAVVDMLANFVRERDPKGRSYTHYRETVEWLQGDGDEYFRYKDLPLNPVRLKEKVQAVMSGKQVQEVVHLPRQGNTNKAEFTADKELKSWCLQYLISGMNPTQSQIVRHVTHLCALHEKKAPSQSWFAKFFTDPEIQQITAQRRFGATHKRTIYFEHTIAVQRAMFAGDAWQVDATRVNMIPHAKQDKTGEQSLIIIAVRDVYSGDILGVHFDTKEDRWGYANALKMAVKASGYLPYSLIHDRFPGHNADEMEALLGGLERKGVHLIKTSKATGKASLERWFDTLQTVFLSNSRYYYGQGIRSTRAFAHRSAEYLAKLTKEARAAGWDFDRAWQDAWQRVLEYKQTAVSHYSRKHPDLHLTPAQLHEQSEKPHVVQLAPWDVASLFWLEKELDIRRNQLEMNVHKQTFTFPILDWNILKTHKRVRVKYEEHDPTKIMVFALHGDVFITELTAQTGVVLYGPDGDPGHLAARQAQIKAFEKERKKTLDEYLDGSADVTMLVGPLAPKADQESAESRILTEHLEASRPFAGAKAEKKPVVPVQSDEIDIQQFIYTNR